MAITLERSLRVLVSQHVVAAASMLALTACGYETADTPDTHLRTVAGETPAALGAARAQEAAELRGAAGDQAAAADPEAAAGDLAEAPANPMDTDTQSADRAASDSAAYSQYIAFGDSFVSGFGLLDAQGQCYLSNHAWPALVNRDLGISQPLIFAACSGATTQDVVDEGAALQNGMITTGPQIAQLPPPEQLDSALMTITIGGNDFKLDERIQKCLNAGQNAPGGASLSSLASLGSLSPDCLDFDQVLDRVDAVVNDSLAPSLDYTFRMLREAAPNATIMAVGYPHVVDATPACDATLFGQLFNARLRQRINDIADAINAQIATAAANAGILSITDEVVAAFAGHEACSPDEWISTLLMHPNTLGHQAYARVVENALPPPPTKTAVAAQEPVPPTETASGG